MEVGEHVHLFATSACNLNCRYCFGPDTQYKTAPGLPAIAEILAANGVKMVTVGGGEPLLAKELEETLIILKEKGIYVSLHTNGILLTNKRIAELSGLVDDIGLPIDTVIEDAQMTLRSEGFRKTFRRIFGIAKKIRENGIDVGWHTVFVNKNKDIIPELYEHLSREPFKYWRIYEFNRYLALQRHAKAGTRQIEKLESIIDCGTEEKGYIDSTFAQFLLVENKMSRHNDRRVQFVVLRDEKPPYIFVEPDGEVRHYLWYSGKERKSLGNIFRDDFGSMTSKAGYDSENPWDWQNEWDDALWSVPLFARLWEGAYWPIELEKVKDEHWAPFLEMAEIFTRRHLLLAGMSEKKAASEARKMIKLFQ